MFFVGHREAGEEVFAALSAAVEKHIVEYGVGFFVVGRYGEFDRLATRAVIEAKKAHPNITLLQLLAYAPKSRPVDLPKGVDGAFYPPSTAKPSRSPIIQVNRYMVERADYLIAYVNHAGNSHDLLEYARQQKRISVENIFPKPTPWRKW